MGNRSQLVWDLPVADSFVLTARVYRVPPDAYRQHARRAGRPARPRAAARPAGPQPLARRADALRAGGGAAAPPAGALPRRADARARRDGPAPAARVRARLQPAARRDRAADQPLDGRRRGAVRPRDRDPPRAAAVSTAPLASLVRRFAARKTIVADLAEDAGAVDLAGLAEVGAAVSVGEGRLTLTRAAGADRGRDRPAASGRAGDRPDRDRAADRRGDRAGLRGRWPPGDRAGRRLTGERPRPGPVEPAGTGAAGG